MLSGSSKLGPELVRPGCCNHPMTENISKDRSLYYTIIFTDNEQGSPTLNGAHCTLQHHQHHQRNLNHLPSLVQLEFFRSRQGEWINCVSCGSGFESLRKPIPSHPIPWMAMIMLISEWQKLVTVDIKGT